MSDTFSLKMADRNHLPISRRNSDEKNQKHLPLQQQNSWPTNHNPTSPRGPIKPTLLRMKSDDSAASTEGDTGSHHSNHNEAVTIDPILEYEGTPEPDRQKQIILSLDVECTCTYAIARTWYKKWEEHVGVPKGMEPGVAEAPGPIEMDTHNDTNNEYVNEEIWKALVHWYGVSPCHQLDRKHLYFKDEKPFDVCMLSPFSGIVEHTIKKFNRFEEIGYIECQLRKIFHVPSYKKSRLWISEKAQVPRFRQLLLRFRMLNDCIHRDKMYILALEVGQGQDLWATGEPGEPKGELKKYHDIVTGPKTEDVWDEEIKQTLDNLTLSLTDTIHQVAVSFLQNSQVLMKEKEDIVESSKKSLEAKLEEAAAREKYLEEKAKQVAKQEESLKQDRQKNQSDLEEFKAKEAKFQEELQTMESMHKIQETKIKLDIGGHMFSTSVHTLKRDADSMLAAMFSGRHQLKQEADGSYFIDRDGTHFRYILNFLRDGCIEQGTLPNDPVLHNELLREAKYFQLSSLVEYLGELLANVRK